MMHDALSRMARAVWRVVVVCTCHDLEPGIGEQTPVIPIVCD